MYSENNRRYAARRADEEFLRRMSGGELCGNVLPTVAAVAAKDARDIPVRDARGRVRCDGSTQDTGSCTKDCEGDTFAPSLAMVYSPRQCWRGLLSPADALAQGSLFSELVLPLEAVPQNGSKEVRIRRPM